MAHKPVFRPEPDDVLHKKFWDVLNRGEIFDIEAIQLGTQEVPQFQPSYCLDTPEGIRFSFGRFMRKGRSRLCFNAFFNAAKPEFDTLRLRTEEGGECPICVMRGRLAQIIGPKLNLCHGHLEPEQALLGLFTGEMIMGFHAEENGAKCQGVADHYGK